MPLHFHNMFLQSKGQIILKLFLVSSISSKKNNERIRLYYYDTSSRLVFFRFLEEIKDTKKPFRNYLTFNGPIWFLLPNIFQPNMKAGD